MRSVVAGAITVPPLSGTRRHLPAPNGTTSDSFSPRSRPPIGQHCATIEVVIRSQNRVQDPSLAPPKRPRRIPYGAEFVSGAQAVPQWCRGWSSAQAASGFISGAEVGVADGHLDRAVAEQFVDRLEGTPRITRCDANVCRRSCQPTAWMPADRRAAQRVAAGVLVEQGAVVAAEDVLAAELSVLSESLGRRVVERHLARAVVLRRATAPAGPSAVVAPLRNYGVNLGSFLQGKSSCLDDEVVPTLHFDGKHSPAIALVAGHLVDRLALTPGERARAGYARYIGANNRAA